MMSQVNFQKYSRTCFTLGLMSIYEDDFRSGFLTFVVWQRPTTKIQTAIKKDEEVRYTKTGFYPIENSESECKAMSSIKSVFSELPPSTRCRSQRDRMMWIVGDTSPAGQGSSPPTQTPIGSQCWHIPHPPLPPLFPHMSVSNVFCRVVRGEEKRWCLKLIRVHWHS